MAFDGGFGVVFRIGDDVLAGGPSYTAIAQVQEWNGIGIANVMADVTAHDASGGYRRKIPSGLLEVDNIELTLVFDITQGTHANASGGLLHAQQNQTAWAYQIQLPDSGTTTFSFDAYVQKFTVTSVKEEAVMAVVILEIDGQPTIA